MRHPGGVRRHLVVAVMAAVILGAGAVAWATTDSSSGAGGAKNGQDRAARQTARQIAAIARPSQTSGATDWGVLLRPLLDGLRAGGRVRVVDLPATEQP